MTTARTLKRSSGKQATLRPWKALPATFGKAVRYAAGVGRFVLVWFGGYLGVAAIVLLAWAFST